MLILQLYSFCYLSHYNLDVSNFGHKKIFIIQNNILSESYNDFDISSLKIYCEQIWIERIIMLNFAMSKSITNQ